MDFVLRYLTAKFGLDGQFAWKGEICTTLEWTLKQTFVQTTMKRIVQYETLKTNERDAMYFLLNVKVCVPRKRQSVTTEDDIYRGCVEAQMWIPRGLCHAFKVDNVVREVCWLGCVYPTSKFFGDTQLDNDDSSVGDSSKQRSLVTGNFLITEKANGEMFAMAVVDKDTLGNFLVVAGSKNNKFGFWIDKTSGKVLNYAQTLKEYGELKTTKYGLENIWIEAMQVFSRDFSKVKHPMDFLEKLYKEKMTLCGELESYLHPHMEFFEDGHQRIKFFAITCYNADLSPKVHYATERTGQLKWLKDLGFDTVEYVLVENTSMQDIRQSTRTMIGREGIVLLVLDDNNCIQETVKIKSVWYIIARGLRERLKHYIRGKRRNLLEDDLVQVVLSKFEWLNIDANSSEGERWIAMAKQVAKFVLQELRSKVELAEALNYRYPSLLRQATNSVCLSTFGETFCN